MSLLEFKNISKSYSGVEVLHDISFQVEKGILYALIGKNGDFTSWGKIQAFIVTLAMMTGARCFALFIAESNSRNIGFGEGAAPEVLKIFTTSFIVIPFPVFIFAAATIIISLIVQIIIWFYSKYFAH